MARSKSSQRWLDEHFKDEYVKQSQDSGYRSRASYKLLEIDKRDGIFKGCRSVLDLGSAPGGWTQVAAKKMGHHLESGEAVVVASDILPMDAIPHVTFVQGDFTDEATYKNILAAVGDTGFDLVLSDMAPNMSGISEIDQPSAMYLIELALDIATEVLKPNGTLLVKAFQGEGFDAYVKQLRQQFSRVVIRKPDASRARSREVYILSSGFKAH